LARANLALHIGGGPDIGGPDHDGLTYAFFSSKNTIFRFALSFNMLGRCSRVNTRGEP
jgi:hypothetical protein